METQELEIKQERLVVRQSVAKIAEEIQKAKAEKRKVAQKVEDKEVAKTLFYKYRNNFMKYKFQFLVAIIVIYFFNVAPFFGTNFERMTILNALVFLLMVGLTDDLNEKGYIEDHIDQKNKKNEDMHELTFHIFGFTKIMRPLAMGLTFTFLEIFSFLTSHFLPKINSLTNFVGLLFLTIIIFTFDSIFYKKIENEEL